MSTFKRLFNVGKGRAKTAQRDITDALSGGADSVKPGEWVQSARHKAADAAEAVAGAIRPEEGAEAEGMEVTDPSAEPEVIRAARSAPVKPEPEVEDAEEVKAKIERADGAPKKRTL